MIPNINLCYWTSATNTFTKATNFEKISSALNGGPGAGECHFISMSSHSKITFMVIEDSLAVTLL